VHVPSPGARGELVEALQLVADLEIRMLDLRDEECAEPEVDRVPGHPGELTERP
jgi:hypothetical protein